MLSYKGWDAGIILIRGPPLMPLFVLISYYAMALFEIRTPCFLTN